jgi:predicted transcriptional regulator
MSKERQSGATRRAQARQSVEYWTASAVLDFTTELWREMLAQGVTQAEIARRTGIAPAQVSRILAGADNVTLRTMSRLAFGIGKRVAVAVKDWEVVAPKPALRMVVATAPVVAAVSEKPRIRSRNAKATA